MKLTDIVKQGKQWGKALLLIASLSCASAPVFQAKRDYDAYPKYRKDIAMYNIQNILKQHCNQPTVDAQGFTCEWATCATYDKYGSSTLWTVIDYDKNSYGSSWECQDKQVTSSTFRWDEIETVSLGASGACLSINGKGCATAPVGRSKQQQLPALVEAINIYLQETRNKAIPNQPAYLK